MNSINEITLIVASKVALSDRLSFYPTFFGSRFMMRGEAYVMGYMTKFSEDYDGGYWGLLFPFQMVAITWRRIWIHRFFLKFLATGFRVKCQLMQLVSLQPCSLLVNWQENLRGLR